MGGLEGQTAQKSLSARLVDVVNSSGTVVVVGWSQHHDDQMISELKSSGRVKFVKDTPNGSPSTLDFFIFTNIVDDNTIRKMQKFTKNLDSRRFTAEGVKIQLQGVYRSIGGSVPETIPAPPVAATQDQDEEPMTPNQPTATDTPETKGSKNLSDRFLELQGKLTGMDAEERRIMDEMRQYREELAKLETSLEKIKRARDLLTELEKL